MFIKEPRKTNELLRLIPSILSGFNYSQDWRQFPHTNSASPSLPFPSAPPQPVNPLRSYFDSHKQGQGIWKWLHYFDIYHHYFRKYVGREVHILEIGVYSGGSLKMWKNYFGDKCHVYGVDIEESCKAYENEYTSIFIGDQADRNFWKALKEKIPVIDIIVDDGGHRSEQQIITLEETLPYLSPGGVYLCEDIHDNRYTSYLQGMVNSLNQMDGGPTLGVKPSAFQSWIKSIHFYPYVTVIEKAEIPEEIFIAPKRGTEWEPFL